MKKLSGYNKIKLMVAAIFMLVYGTWFGAFITDFVLGAVLFVVPIVWAAIYLFVKGWRYGYVFLMTLFAGAGLIYGIELESIWIVCCNILTILVGTVFLAIDGYRTDVCIGKQNDVLFAIAAWIVGLISVAMVGFVIIWGGVGLFMLGSGAEDYEWELYQECIEHRINMGYPEKEVKEFCMDISWGCSDKVYAPDCNAELFCCLDDIDVHKKWNYLHK